MTDDVISFEIIANHALNSREYCWLATRTLRRYIVA